MRVGDQRATRYTVHSHVTIHSDSALLLQYKRNGWFPSHANTNGLTSNNLESFVLAPVLASVLGSLLASVLGSLLASVLGSLLGAMLDSALDSALGSALLRSTPTKANIKTKEKHETPHASDVRIGLAEFWVSTADHCVEGFLLVSKLEKHESN